MTINQLTKAEVLRTLVTSEQGLSDEEAAKRLLEFGPNSLSEVRRTHPIIRLFGQFTHFLAILLWVAALLSFISDRIHPGEGMLTLGLAIVAVIVVNAAFTTIQEYRAQKALEALGRLLPFFVTVVRDGREHEVHANAVVPGEVILLTEGDKVPADARLIETRRLMVNHASLTGESEPLLRVSDSDKKEFTDSANIVFASTTVTSGSGRAVVFATGMRTEFGRIAHLTGGIEPGLTPLQKEIIKATRVVAVIAGAVGLFFFALGLVIGRSFWENFIFAIGITVALIPEGMLPTVTLALAMGSQRMAKHKALIKKLTAVETLGSVTVICTDKTGTLTQNNMIAKAIWADDRFTERDILRACAFCNNARFLEGRYKGDPTETALLKAAREALGDIGSTRLFEIPFDADRKMMTTINAVGERSTVYTKGAFESLVPLCVMDDTARARALETYHALMDRGLRVLAVAKKELAHASTALETTDKNADQLEKDMTFLGLIGLHDPPRPEVSAAIGKCREAGIRIIMITGDGSRTAAAIAREIGLVGDNPVLIEGAEFNRLSDHDLRAKLAEREIIFARMTPKSKLRVVSLLKEAAEVVAVTGDGVNDAPALKMADIGIAMGIAGTDVAKEASDIILLDDNFATIVRSVEEGRTVYENIKKFITYIFASNIPEAIPYLAYILFRIPLPLTILQILTVDLGTDMLPGLALGSEPPTPNVMRQPPRKQNAHLLDPFLLVRGYLFLGVMESVACMFGFFWVLRQGGWAWGTQLPPSSPLYMQATTACLTAIVVAQIGNVFACRSSGESLFRIGFFSNRLVFGAITAELLLQLLLVYHPFFNRIFSTAPLPWKVWLMLAPFGFALLFAEETRKLISRKMKRASSS